VIAMVKKKQQFGGIVIDFSNQQKTLEELFGDKPITPADMTKKLWKVVKRNKLMKRKVGRKLVVYKKGDK
tara:strand:- start:490 stop:699 length:210 start_codon:yes stop_codon:yes gene_type:complete